MVFAFLGTTEIIIILVIALLVFGPQKLPEIGKQVGTAMRELNKVRNDVQKALEMDDFTNLNSYDTYNHNTYDGNHATANNALPHYESPQGVTHPASADAYTSHYGVDDDAVYHNDTVAGSGFVAPPGPKPASVLPAEATLPTQTETGTGHEGTV